MLINRTSSISGKTNVMDIEFTPAEAVNFCKMQQIELFAGMTKWSVPGMLIQDAFPTQNADVREFLMTGITPEEWENLSQ